MKTVLKMMASLLLAVCLMSSMLAVAAQRYDFSDGSIPDGWTHLGSDDVDKVTASAILDPVNPNASQEAKNLYAYLSTLSDTQTMLSGQFDIKTNDYAYQATVEQFGLEPALYSTRYTVDTGTPVWVLDKGGNKTLQLAEGNTAMDFLNVDEANALLKAHYDNGNVLLVHSDGAIRSVCFAQARENKPDLYTDYANCIRELDATNPDRDMQTYALWRRFQENEITALKALEDMGVKAYLWRTWVEFNYQPFFGADEEGYAHFVRVYQQTVDAMIESGLTGFLVCYSPGAKSNTLQRYPGNEYVDTVAVTLYSESILGGSVSPADLVNYEWYVRTGKPLGLSEWSCRTGAWQETASRPRSSSFELLQSTITYFPAVTWVDFWDGNGYWPLDLDGSAMGNDDGLLYLESPFTITLDEMVDYRHTNLASPGVVQLYGAFADGGYVGLEEGMYSGDRLQAMGIDLTQLSAVRVNTDYTVTLYTGNDGTGDAMTYGASVQNIAKSGTVYRSCVVRRLGNIAYDKWQIFASVNDDDAWKANDGNSTIWEGDVFSSTNEAEPGTAWLYVDLEETHLVGHYVLRLAGYAGRQAQYNVVTYQLQYSNDGQTWTSVDRVTGNTLSQLDRYFNPVVAQYFRVLIEDPNAALAETDRGYVGVAELELYGLPQELPVEPEPPTTTTKKPTTTTTKKPTTTIKKPTTTTAVKPATPKVTASNATKGIKVTWNKVSKADKYYVYRRLYSSGKWGSWSKIKTTTAVSYTDEAAKTGKNYQYMVRAVKGDSTGYYKATATITRLGVPKVTAANATKGIKVSWGKVTGATSYRVYRRLYSSGKWGSWSKVTTTKSLSYTDTKAKTGKNYQYMVRAVKGDSTGYYKATDTIRRLKAPGSVKLKKAIKGFKVTWSKTAGATKYEVYRRTGSGSWSKVASTSKTGYTDKTAKKGKYYTYRVRAVYSKSKSVFKTSSKVKR